MKMTLNDPILLAGIGKLNGLRLADQRIWKAIYETEEELAALFGFVPERVIEHPVLDYSVKILRARLSVMRELKYAYLDINWIMVEGKRTSDFHVSFPLEHGVEKDGRFHDREITNWEGLPKIWIDITRYQKQRGYLDRPRPRSEAGVAAKPDDELGPA